MRVRTLAVGLLCSSVALTACSGGSGDKGSGKDSSPAASSGKKSNPAPPPVLPANYRKIGGAKNGFTAGVPKSWKPLDLKSLPQARAALQETGLSASAADQTIKTLNKNHAVLVMDPKSGRTARFAANLNGFCAAGTAPSADQIKAQLQQIGARNVATTDVTVGGQSGQKTTYERSVGTMVTTGVQYQVTGDSGKTCFITMTEKKSTKAPFAKIGATIHAL
jgi:hypothetical protein